VTEPQDAATPGVPFIGRFALLRHVVPPESVLYRQGRRDHWDLLVERPETDLLAWQLATLPTDDQPAVPALALPVHRRVYLDYEGQLNGDRGRVEAWDRGTCRWLEVSAGQLSLELIGQRTRGLATLTHLGDIQWQLHGPVFNVSRSQ
jgi:hypothetical protein